VFARPLCWRGSLPLRALLAQLLSRCIRVLCIADIRNVYPDSRPPNRRHPHRRGRRAPRSEIYRETSLPKSRGSSEIFLSGRNPTVTPNSVENAHHLSINAHTQKVESHPSVRFYAPATFNFRLFAPTSGSPKGRGRSPHFTESVPTRPETYRAREYTRAYTPRTLPTPPLSPKDAGALGRWRGHPKLISEEETRPEKGYPEARLSHDRHNATWPRRPPKSRRRRFPRRPMYPR
jgi:hypothetical protein